MRLLTIFLACIFLASCSTTKNNDYRPSESETINAVKNLMSGSSANALTMLSKTQQNGIESILPEEVRPIISTLRTLGLTKEITKVDNLLKSSSGMIYAQGNAIMNEAIKDLKINGAANILNGNDNAASLLLKEAMSSTIKSRYNDKISSALKAIPETKYWDIAVSTYNTFAKNKISGSLEDFITDTAVDAVFEAMSSEETKIRKNPASLNNEEFTKVFEYYQSQQNK